MIPKFPLRNASAIAERELKTNIEERRFDTAIEQREFKTNIESRYHDPYGQRVVALDVRRQADAPSYNVIGREGVARGRKLLAGTQSLKHIVILNEILGKPKGMA